MLSDGIERTLPSCTDKRQLADEMGNFFKTKIENIRADLSSRQFQNKVNVHMIHQQDLPTLDDFHQIPEDKLSEE